MNIVARSAPNPGKRKAWKAAPLLAICLASATFAQAGETVLYRQVFGNDGEGNGDISSVNWEHFFSGEGHAWCIAGIPGQPQDLPNVNTSQPAKSLENGVLHCPVPPDGYYFARPAASERIGFIKQDLDPSHYKSLVFRWHSGATTENQTQRLAIQIGSKWYASESTFQNVIGWNPFAEQSLQANVEFSAEGKAWRELFVEPGNKFRLGDQPLSENLPSGAIKNFGIFCENAGGTPQSGSAVDTFEVVGTPLP